MSFPLSFTLSTSSSPRSPTSDQSAFTHLTQTATLRALSTVSSLSLKLDWIERLSEPNTPLSVMKESIEILDRIAYDDLLQERHALRLCPYPACGNAAGSEYDPRGSGAVRGKEKKMSVKLTSNGMLVDAKGKGREKGGAGAFCSSLCEARSNWFAGMLGSERREMLEDVERRRRDVDCSTRDIVREMRVEQEGMTTTTTTTTTEEMETEMETETQTKRTLPKPPLPPPSDSTTTLLSSLTIHERPTPTSPSSHLPPSSSPHPAPIAPPRPSPSRTFTSTRSSLLPFSTTNLSTTLLRASSSLKEEVKPTLSEGGKFVEGPFMVDEQGRRVEWDEEEGEGEGEGEVREWMEEALRERRRARERGEIE